MDTNTIFSRKPWLAAYGPDTPEHLRYPETRLPELLASSSRDFPDHTALIFEGYRMSYRDLAGCVDRFAAWLHSEGFGKGDVAAIVLPNTIPSVIAFWAVLKAEGIVCMGNPLHTDRELARQLNGAGAQTVITLDLLAERIIRLRNRTGITTIVHTSLGDYLPFPKKLLFPLVAGRKKLTATVPRTEQVFSWKTVMNHPGRAATKPSLSPSDPAMYQYTGGTTGIPKGVILTHANLCAQVRQIEAWFPMFENGKERMLGALPLFHIFGLTVVMLYAVYKGWGNVLVPKPHAGALLKAIRKFRPSFAPLVPTMYISMLDHPQFTGTDLTSLKGCFSGSASLPVSVIREFEKRTGALIVEGYGLTEASPVTHVNPFVAGGPKPGSVGVPVPDTEARIVDLKDGPSDMNAGEPGELLVRGPQVMAGYRNMEEENRAVLTHGWLHTGDVAVMDEEGYFFIIDRIKDLIVTGGQNVYPREVDEVLHEHPAVLDGCAAGVPHPVLGEVVKAFVVLRKGQVVTDQEIVAFCRERLAKYKVPVEVEFRKSLPRNLVGKVLRRELTKAGNTGEEDT